MIAIRYFILILAYSAWVNLILSSVTKFGTYIRYHPVIFNNEWLLWPIVVVLGYSIYVSMMLLLVVVGIFILKLSKEPNKKYLIDIITGYDAYVTVKGLIQTGLRKVLNWIKDGSNLRF